MALTTTDRVNQPRAVRCDRCKGLARGGLLVRDEAYGFVGACCARDGGLAAAMVAQSPDREEELETPIAHDPLGSGRGPDRRAIARFGLTYGPLEAAGQRADPHEPLLPVGMGRPIQARRRR
jgi:hypothetical protein